MVIRGYLWKTAARTTARVPTGAELFRRNNITGRLEFSTQQPADPEGLLLTGFELETLSA
ncbi:hypothetical protein CA54_41830 [Symmachiella macrocystis]|uniref:Uncharacterized protein n=1 Tax=Symmachiella macrocystis TaxID=2527985 RepID=A0A5C6BEQ1_9PLAN|nr:hypothetical protein CA54_41830 [Symmachiella macrocystis]